jgi:hypothetical protein
MFEIEYVAVRDTGEPQVVEKMTSNFVRLVDADKIAKSLLEKVRHKRRSTPPDGYQIRAHDGRVVLRFLDRRRPADAGESRKANSTSEC